MDMAPLGPDDREALQHLAAMGNDDATDRLADLAYEQRDIGELSMMLDDGYERAGELMTQLAVADRDLIRLQELSDAGVAEAQEALGVLLSRP
jgi:hypothetical protein